MDKRAGRDLIRNAQAENEAKAETYADAIIELIKHYPGIDRKGLRDKLKEIQDNKYSQAAFGGAIAKLKEKGKIPKDF